MVKREPNHPCVWEERDSSHYLHAGEGDIGIPGVDLDGAGGSDPRLAVSVDLGVLSSGDLGMTVGVDSHLVEGVDPRTSHSFEPNRSNELLPTVRPPAPP